MTLFRAESWRPFVPLVAVSALLVCLTLPSLTQQPKADAPKKEVGSSSYDQISPVLLGQESFATMMAKDKAGKADIMARQKALLEERYDLILRAHKGVKMTRGKSIPMGPTAKLPEGLTWEKLAKMSPEQLRGKGLFPKGYLPLPHPNHSAGGMVFPQHQIKQFKRLERFDLDFDLPEHFLPEFPPAIFLTTRPDLGDVSQGKVVTIENFQDIFQGILNAKDMEGLRLLLTQFPQQQFNATHDRKTEIAGLGVTCFDCHLNGHTVGSTHLVGDIRPQAHRRRIETPSLRGVNIQRLFGSQRALKTVEDFTEFEQLAAYFDGDHLSASAKGQNRLDRSTQVHFMSEFQELLDFPPAQPGYRRQAQPQEVRGRFFRDEGAESLLRQGEVCQLSSCSLLHRQFDAQSASGALLQAQMINGLMATSQGPIKTFPLRGIKESPPYLHDGRLLTLEDTVEFFNLILETDLTAEEKRDLVAFMLQL